MSKKREYKEELSTEMHSEFTVSKEVEIQHTAFSALNIYAVNKDLEKVLKWYDVTKEQLIQHLPEYNRINRTNLTI